MKTLYAFVFDFCDWYIEAAKPRLQGADAAARRDVSANLLWTLERILLLTHPVLPVRDRGGVVAPARRARPADARAVPGAGRRAPRPGGRGRRAGRHRGRLAGPLDARRAARAARTASRRRRSCARSCRGRPRWSTTTVTACGGRGRGRGSRRSCARGSTSELARARAELDRARGDARRTSASPPRRPAAKVEEERAKEARFAAEVGRAGGEAAGARRDGRPTPTSTRSSSSACASASSACTGCSTRLGNPERSFDAIHVVGTNGKGSTTLYAEALLLAEGIAHRRLPLAAPDLVSRAHPDRRAPRSSPRPTRRRCCGCARRSEPT